MKIGLLFLKKAHVRLSNERTKELTNEPPNEQARPITIRPGRGSKKQTDAFCGVFNKRDAHNVNLLLTALTLLRNSRHTAGSLSALPNQPSPLFQWDR